jgi:hypothetical protein
MQRQLVFLGIGRNGLEPQLISGAKHANGDFAAIGDEDFLDWHLGHIRAGGIKDPFAGSGSAS